MKRLMVYLSLTIINAALLAGAYFMGGISDSAWASAPHKTLTANKFLLVDKYGKEKGQLGINNHGDPFLRLYDNNGKTRVFLALLHDENPTVGLVDKRDKIRTYLQYVDSKDVAGLGVNDDSSRKLVYLGVKDGEASFLTMSDKVWSKTMTAAVSDRFCYIGMGERNWKNDDGAYIRLKDGVPQLSLKLPGKPAKVLSAAE